MKVSFLTTLDVRFHDGVQWQLTAPFVAVAEEGEYQRIIRVPDGFLTDFASIPRLPLVYLHFANRAHRPAVVHDWLYAEGGTEIDRKYADEVFYNGMLGTGIEPNDARAMFDAVRQFGAKYFHLKGIP